MMASQTYFIARFAKSLLSLNSIFILPLLVLGCFKRIVNGMKNLGIEWNWNFVKLNMQLLLRYSDIISYVIGFSMLCWGSTSGDLYSIGTIHEMEHPSCK
jgi:hypothetical protein